jgi:hypothetical protein
MTLVKPTACDGGLALAGKRQSAWWCFQPRWTQLADVVGQLHGVTFFSQVGRRVGLRISPGRPASTPLVVIALGLGIAAAAIWHGLRNGRFKEWWTWMVWMGFVVCTAGLTVPRGYSAKQILVTG